MNKAAVLTWAVYSGVLLGIFPVIKEYLQLTTAYVYLDSKIYSVEKEAGYLVTFVYMHISVFIKFSR